MVIYILHNQIWYNIIGTIKSLYLGEYKMNRKEVETAINEVLAKRDKPVILKANVEVTKTLPPILDRLDTLEDFLHEGMFLMDDGVAIHTGLKGVIDLLEKRIAIVKEREEIMDKRLEQVATATALQDEQIIDLKGQLVVISAELRG